MIYRRGIVALEKSLSSVHLNLYLILCTSACSFGNTKSVKTEEQSLLLLLGPVEASMWLPREKVWLILVKKKNLTGSVGLQKIRLPLSYTTARDDRNLNLSDFQSQIAVLLLRS